jgi:hypothetical protein
MELRSVIKNKWKDHLYQNIEFLENNFSYGPKINVHDINGFLFSCKLLDLFDLLKNSEDYLVKIVIDTNVLESNCISTLIHMLEEYIINHLDELNITIIKEFKSINILEHSYEFRKEKLNKFYAKLIDWKNNILEIELLNNYDLKLNKILYYIDFNNLFLNKKQDLELESLDQYYNIKIRNYDDDYDDFQDDEVYYKGFFTD